jgi:hypothetical protein
MVPAEQNSLRYAEHIARTDLDRNVKALLVLIGITMGDHSPFWAMVHSKDNKTGIFVRNDHVYMVFQDKDSLVQMRETVYLLFRAKQLLAVAERPTPVPRPGMGIGIVAIRFPLVPNWRTLLWDS